MASPLLDNAIFSQMAEIITCLCAKIDENELPKPCFCGMLAGDIAYDMMGANDDCDSDDEGGCGQAWVRLVNAYPSVSVGVAELTPGNCTKAFGYDLEIGILRCSPIEEKGGAMDPAEMLATTQLQIADMLTMQQAIMCCTAFETDDFVMGTYQPIGPEGGVVGGIWPVSIMSMMTVNAVAP